MLQRRLIIESVLQPSREDSEVSWSRRGFFRQGRPRFCPAGGRTPAASPQPVRESAAARAPAPGPRLPRPSLLGLVLAAPWVAGGLWEEACPLPIHLRRRVRGSGGEGRRRARRGVLGAPLDQTRLPKGANSGRPSVQGWVGAAPCPEKGPAPVSQLTSRCCLGREGNR